MSLCGTDYAIGAVRNMYKESRQDNAMVVMPSKLQKGLPRRTGSLCPECLKVIPATLYIGDGALKMKKTCKEHGEFDEVCWSDAEMYLRAENWAFDGVGLENPQIVDAKVCPYECGLCNLHYSATSLCNIDLTNRCNLKCRFVSPTRTRPGTSLSRRSSTSCMSSRSSGPSARSPSLRFSSPAASRRSRSEER